MTLVLVLFAVPSLGFVAFLVTLEVQHRLRSRLAARRRGGWLPLGDVELQMRRKGMR